MSEKSYVVAVVGAPTHPGKKKEVKDYSEI